MVKVESKEKVSKQKLRKLVNKRLDLLEKQAASKYVNYIIKIDNDGREQKRVWKGKK